MSELKLIPLGGMGKVTQNLYVYQYQDEILLIDCGIGFPDVYMPGVDAIIPDISYLQKQVEKGKKIVGLIFSHGHDDHTAAAGYLLPDLPDFPLYASSLTAGFAEERLKDQGVDKRVEVVPDKTPIKVGSHFEFQLIAVTHSVPDTKHIVLKTPVGTIYHGSDYKLDPKPVDGVLTDFEAISQVGKEGVLLTLLDCLRVEKEEWIKSESAVGPALEKEMFDVKGKILVTLMSSHIHRIQQVVDLAVKLGRKLVFVGRSVEQNTKVAGSLNKLKIPRDLLVDKKYVNDYPGHKLLVIIAGSQGQEGSSLKRAVYGEHRVIQIKKTDRVIFSANVIPGNEIPYYDAIDELARNGIEVVYPDIAPDIHQSGHASAAEQTEIISLLKPKSVMPIGGADRHRALFRTRVAKPLGYHDHQVLIPKAGQVLSITKNECKVVDKIKLRPRIVDGLGIGDVGPVVLSDRLTLSKAGIIVLVIPQFKGKLELDKIEVISKGFVFMKHAEEVVEFIKEKTAEIIRRAGRKTPRKELKRMIEKRLGRRLYKIIKREPMIVPMFLER
ncbi:MAG: ribonuclease J [Candidatus Woesebacteria bacterium]|jgi:ribonuclease J